MKCVILAGGAGTRFWPYSRKNNPKQLLNIIGQKSMLQITIDRLKKVSLITEIFIITRTDLHEFTLREIEGIPLKNIIAEPSGKNTAPAIGMMAALFSLTDKNEVMGIFPADHLIVGHGKFKESINNAYKVAKEGNNLVTIGIEPTYASTAYGYIQFDESSDKKVLNAFSVKTFAEKPHKKLAKRFLLSGDFLWNAGMFFWKVETFMNNMKNLMPELTSLVIKIAPKLAEGKSFNGLWDKIKPESIDFGLLEKSNNIYVVTANFKWNDVGSWRALYDVLNPNDDGNIIRGNGKVIDGENNLIQSDKNFTAIIGLDNVVVVNTKDATLVVKKDDVEKVKDLVSFLEKKKKDLI